MPAQDQTVDALAESSRLGSLIITAYRGSRSGVSDRESGCAKGVEYQVVKTALRRARRRKTQRRGAQSHAFGTDAGRDVEGHEVERANLA